jgi:hypothetical protein
MDHPLLELFIEVFGPWPIWLWLALHHQVLVATNELSMAKCWEELRAIELKYVWFWTCLESLLALNGGGDHL